MDSSPKPPKTERVSPFYSISYCCFALLFSLTLSFFLSFVSGFVAVAIGRASVSPLPSVPTLCRIVSSSVDLRSSKICELGFLNYKAKRVFYSFEGIKFHCRYDYYWASILKVEYKEDSSGQIFHALAEAPKEALPLDCRPSFNMAWMMKAKFKVNETYNCSYKPGVSTVDILPGSLLNCKAKEPSILEMLRRFYFLLTMSTKAPLLKTVPRKSASLGALIGLALGMLVPIVFTCSAKFLLKFKARLVNEWSARNVHHGAYQARVRRACILAAYLSAMGWLAGRYVRMIGMDDFFPL